MSSTANTFDLSATVLRVVPEVFATMLRLPVTNVARFEANQSERVSGSIGIAGPVVTGSFFIHISAPLARRAAAAMLGLEPNQTPDDDTVNDVTSELANMVCGGIKSVLCDSGWPCGMSTPSVIRGFAFSIELPQGAVAETFSFDCMGESLAVEIHLKLD